MRMANETILLVEDDGPVRGLFVRALTTAGYHVIAARNGVEALDALDQPGADVQLLITDMRMPHLGGAQLIGELRRRGSALKVLCVSAHPVLEDVHCHKFLSKPFTNAEFLAAVRDLISSGEHS